MATICCDRTQFTLRCIQKNGIEIRYGQENRVGTFDIEHDISVLFEKFTDLIKHEACEDITIDGLKNITVCHPMMPFKGYELSNENGKITCECKNDKYQFDDIFDMIRHN